MHELLCLSNHILHFFSYISYDFVKSDEISNLIEDSLVFKRDG